MTEEQSIELLVSGALEKMGLQDYFDRLGTPPPRGELNQTVYFESIGMFWRLMRNQEGVSLEDLATKTDTGDMNLRLFEMGMAPVEQVREFPSKYARAMGKEAVHLRLYGNFLEKWKIPKHIYEASKS